MAEFVLDFVPEFDVAGQIFVSNWNPTNRADFLRHQSVFTRFPYTDRIKSAH